LWWWYISTNIMFISKTSSCLCFKTQRSETGFCLRLQVKPTKFGSIDRASHYLRSVMFRHINRTMDNVQKHKINPSIIDPHAVPLSKWLATNLIHKPDKANSDLQIVLLEDPLQFSSPTGLPVPTPPQGLDVWHFVPHLPSTHLEKENTKKFFSTYESLSSVLSVARRSITVISFAIFLSYSCSQTLE
jgi:hypothetical protein